MSKTMVQDMCGYLVMWCRSLVHCRMSLSWQVDTRDGVTLISYDHDL